MVKYGAGRIPNAQKNQNVQKTIKTEGVDMTKDQKWIVKNFGKLIKKYAGKYIAIVNKKVVAVGKSAKKVEEIAIKKTGVKIPSVLPIPKKAHLTHVL